MKASTLLIPNPPGLSCGSIRTTQMKSTQTTAIVPMGLLHFPRFHGPGLNESPARNRRNVGITYAIYSPITAMAVAA